MVRGCKIKRPSAHSAPFDTASESVPIQSLVTARIFEVTTYVTYNMIRQVFPCNVAQNNRDLGMMNSLSEHHTRAILIVLQGKKSTKNMHVVLSSPTALMEVVEQCAMHSLEEVDNTACS